MLEGFRNAMAQGISILAQRVSTEPRWPNQRRVPSTPRTLAGVLITPDSALTIPAVWACFRFLTQTVAVLPWHALKDGGNGAEIQAKNPVDWLLYKRPNPEWSSFQFRETMLHWALRWGNGYAEIERDQLGRPFALWPIHPDRVKVCRDPDTGILFYEVSNGPGGGDGIEIEAADMFHLRGFGEGVVGVNVIDYAAQSLGWAKAAQMFGASFFGNGATPTTVVKNKKGLSPKGLEKQRAEFEQLYKGPYRANKTAFLDNDADISTIGLNAEQTQLLETHQFLVEEICRWFGVPPHKIMHLLRATFSNIEHQAIEVVVDSITPWAKRFEDEADFKLFGQNRQGLYTKMNVNALLRGDMKSRMEFYKGMQYVGAYSPNKILELEDENTLGPDGDIHVMQSQFTTLDKIGETPPPPIGHNGGPPLDQPVPDQAAADAMADFNRILASEPAHV
ncbi:HK97 family phage portal protein [Mesorhizobium loti]|uniref:HK97 family phage portal protein n=1 Tax=Rhizobium loti TaxID=381 RepID=A0A8E2WFM0_RHILI|nr:phage portal protein [Mesorhizobium loti]PWJ93543.1 HK97 family phage portal protein [Mesorhizobium loti]